jgi:hypothetical protein
MTNKLDIQMNICDYGCGREAKFMLKSGKRCCSKWTSSCPEVRKKNSQGLKNNSTRSNFVNEKGICCWCLKTITKINLKRHEDKCYLNPKNFNPCPICGRATKKGRSTCSRKCRLKFFGPPNVPESSELKHYRTICFRYHKKKCVVCGEIHFIDVHHYDKNIKNNDPRNLVPLCILHHKYVHHKELKYIVKECIDEYVDKFSRNWNSS